MEKAPLFSIITITFNAEGVLAPTLDSLGEQDFTDFEHVVIDGASTDSTLGLLAEGKLPQTRLLSEPDAGLYDAMNKGLRMARGKYVLFLNAGDAFHSHDTLSKYAAAAAGNPSVIYGDTILVDADRKFVGRRHLSVPQRLDFKSFRRGMLVCHQAFMVRKDITGFYDLSYRFSADYDWCLRCLKKTSADECVNLGCVVIDYLTDGLTDKNHVASLLERFKIMCRHYGCAVAVLNHVSFLPRYFSNKVKNVFFLKNK